MEIPEHIWADAQLYGKSQKELTSPLQVQKTRREFLGLSRLSVVIPPQVERETSYRAKKALIGVLAAMSLIGEASQAVGDMDSEGCTDIDIACRFALEGMEHEITQASPTTLSPETTVPPTTTETAVPTTLPPSTTVPVTAPTVAPAAVSNPERLPAAPETIAAIAAMNLTPEGYQNFFNTIDQSKFDFAQGFANFNPAQVAIPQNPTEWVTAHYTASYTNPDGPGQQPVGEMVVERLVDFMANRGVNSGSPCCGVNFIIDRNGTIFQTAPFSAKLRHDGPYDGKTTGFEMEAAYQEQLTTAQYESAAYLTIAMLHNDGLLGTKPLTEIFKGHGEMRDTYREQHPGSDWDVRNDFDASVIGALRPKLEAFIANTPNIAELTQPLR